MKRLLILVAGVGLALSACEPTVGNQPTVTAGNNVIMRGEQALIIAHNAYQGAAAMAELAVKSGRLTSDQLTRLRSLNDQALALLNKADAGVDVANNAAQVMGLTSQIRTLLKGDIR